MRIHSAKGVSIVRTAGEIRVACGCGSSASFSAVSWPSWPWLALAAVAGMVIGLLIGGHLP